MQNQIESCKKKNFFSYQALSTYSYFSYHNRNIFCNFAAKGKERFDL